MDRRTLWDTVVAQRLALAEHLRTFTSAEWSTPSLCEGWTVKDVAAHVISSPQLTWPATLAVLPSIVRHGYHGAILRDGQRRGHAPVEQLLADYERWAPVRRGPAAVTRVEALLDVLVHTQDILRPVGRQHPVPIDAAVVAADRCLLLAPMLGSRRTLRRVRLVAADADWAHGRGPAVTGPMEELLMVCAGRSPDLARIRGDGVRLVASRGH